MAASLHSQIADDRPLRTDDSMMSLQQCTLFQHMTLRQPSLMVSYLTGSVIVMLAATLAWSWMAHVDLVVEGSAQVRSKQRPIQIVNRFSSQWVHLGAGYQVDEQLCREGQSVEQGDVLFRFACERLHHELERLDIQIAKLDDTIARHQKQHLRYDRQGELKVSQAVAELTRAEAELVDQTRRQALNRSMAQTKLSMANERWDRIRRLARAKAASQEEVSQSKTSVKLAEDELALVSEVVDASSVKAARLAIDLANQDVELREAELLATLGRHVSDRNRLVVEQKDIRNELKHSQLVAPITGVVTNVNVLPGATVQPGQVLAVITPNDERMVYARLHAKDIADVVVGCRAIFQSESSTGDGQRPLSGRVAYVSPDAHVSPDAQPDGFDPTSDRPGDFMVHIELDPLTGSTRNPAPRLGMTGTVDIVTDRQSLIKVLARGTKSAFRF